MDPKMAMAPRDLTCIQIQKGPSHVTYLYHSHFGFHHVVGLHPPSWCPLVTWTSYILDG